MAKLARQVDFDQIVREIVQSGGSWDDAAAEAIETFTESNYDLSALFIYTNKAEYEEKEQVEKRCRTIEDVGVGKATMVNMIFALQGLTQKINSSPELAKKSIRLLESRGVLNSLLKALQTLQKSDDDEEDEENSHGEEDSDDEDENKVLQKVEIWNFILYLLSLSPNFYFNFEGSLTLTEEGVAIVMKALDEDSDELR